MADDFLYFHNIRLRFLTKFLIRHVIQWLSLGLILFGMEFSLASKSASVMYFTLCPRLVLRSISSFKLYSDRSSQYVEKFAWG